jgi:hypothetical protein
MGSPVVLPLDHSSSSDISQSQLLEFHSTFLLCALNTWNLEHLMPQSCCFLLPSCVSVCRRPAGVLRMFLTYRRTHHILTEPVDLAPSAMAADCVVREEFVRLLLIYWLLDSQLIETASNPQYNKSLGVFESHLN